VNPRHCPTCTCPDAVPACLICERPLPTAHWSYCHDCFVEWYDIGERDPAKIKAKVLAMRTSGESRKENP